MALNDISDHEFKFIHPFTCLVCGPTGSGKSVWVRRFLTSHEDMISPSKPVLNVIWCYGQYQSLYNVPLPSQVQVTYVEGLPSMEDIKKMEASLIVIDDLMSELGDDKKLSDLFTKGSHHLDLSVIFIVQNLFHQGKVMRTISINTHYMTLFKSPRDKQQISKYAQQIFPGNSKYFMEAYDDATKKPFSYINVDFRPYTDDTHRLRTNILPGENMEGIVAPTVYLPK